MSISLHSLARRHFLGHTPNPSNPLVRQVVDPNAALTGFLLNLQQGHNDIDGWTEAEWKDVLQSELGVGDDDLSDLLENVASWGVVDDDFHYPEAGGTK